MIVNLHIDRLVLDGVAAGSHEGPLVRDALEAELARLLAAPGAARHFGEDRTVQRIRSEGMGRPDGGMAGLGEHIGKAVFEAIAG